GRRCTETDIIGHDEQDIRGTFRSFDAFGEIRRGLLRRAADLPLEWLLRPRQHVRAAGSLLALGGRSCRWVLAGGEPARHRTDHDNRQRRDCRSRSHDFIPRGITGPASKAGRFLGMRIGPIPARGSLSPLGVGLYGLHPGTADLLPNKSYAKV